MEDMIQNHPQPDHTILEHIIFGCGLRGHWNRARKLLTTMPTRRSLKLIPTVKTHNTAIFAHTRNGMWERSVNLLTDMKAANLQPDAFTYMSVITACDTAKQRELALQLSAEMEQVNFNWLSFLFQACCAYCASTMCVKSCANVSQYYVLCIVHCDNQAGIAPLDLIDSVQQRGIEPVDLEIHTMLLQYYGIVGSILAQQLHSLRTYMYAPPFVLPPVHQIAQEGPAPTAVTYELAIELAQDDASIQQVLKANMASHGIKPTPFERLSTANFKAKQLACNRFWVLLLLRALSYKQSPAKQQTSRMSVVPLRFGVKFSPPTIALEHAMPDSSDQPRLLEVPLIPFLEQHNEDPASVVKALKAAFPEHFDPTVVSYKQVLRLVEQVLQGRQASQQQQQQQQQADKHDAWDMRRSDTNEQSDEKTLQPEDKAADLTVQNATKSSLDDLPPLFGSARRGLLGALPTVTQRTSYVQQQGSKADDYDEDFSDNADALQLPHQPAVAVAVVAAAVKVQQPPVHTQANDQIDDAARRDILGLSDNDVHDEEEVLDESLEDFSIGKYRHLAVLLAFTNWMTYQLTGSVCTAPRLLALLWHCSFESEGGNNKDNASDDYFG
eukprot:16727-Heterococcus_DN1.PRE.2